MDIGEEDVVIVGAGLAGLATALGLYRKGIKSLVLESSETLRTSGFAFTTWTNAWRALDALGVGDSVRHQHVRLQGLVVASGTNRSYLSFMEGKSGKHEIRCVKRNLLLETLAKELPQGTIRYSAKVVSIEDAGNLKLLHLADGSMLKTKVLIGCDGVNSVVAKWLGLKKPLFARRSATRGFAQFPDGHGFKPEFLQLVGDGYRSGLIPCGENSIYWFFTFTPSAKDKEVEEDASKMRQFVLNKLRDAKVPQEVEKVIEKSEMADVISSPLRFRWPFELLRGRFNKDNVCVAGDALHPMTPDLGQGACSALEDSVVLARCLSEALLGGEDGGEYERIKKGLEKFAGERRWRSFGLISTAYVVGYIQQSDNAVLSFIRDKFLAGMMANMLLKKAEFDCGKL